MGRNSSVYRKTYGSWRRPASVISPIPGGGHGGHDDVVTVSDLVAVLPLPLP